MICLVPVLLARQPEKPEGPLPSLVFGASWPRLLLKAAEFKRPVGKPAEACLQRHGRAPDAISPIEFRFTCLTYKIRSWLQNGLFAS